MMRRRQQKRQHRVADDVVDAEPVAGRPGFVVDVEQGRELGLVREGDAPEVERSVAVLGNHLDAGSGFVLVNEAGSFGLVHNIVVSLKRHRIK